jgi:hypothetical protein
MIEPWCFLVRDWIGFLYIVWLNFIIYLQSIGRLLNVELYRRYKKAIVVCFGSRRVLTRRDKEKSSRYLMN